jgi:hypothetical protein
MENIDLTNQEGHNMNNFLKEYELCWQGIQHNNTRLWTSASIFLAGSVVTFVKMVELPLSLGCWSQFFSVFAVSSVILTVLGLYCFIFRSMVLLDRIDILRSEELEKSLGLWRMRYHSFMHENQNAVNENESKRFKAVKEELIKRLGTSHKWFWTYKFANKAIYILLGLISFITFAYCIVALGITSGWRLP